MFSEARDQAAIFGEECLFRTTETGISRVFITKAREVKDYSEGARKRAGRTRTCNLAYPVNPYTH
jgi:hypothetical protein